MNLFKNVFFNSVIYLNIAKLMYCIVTLFKLETEKKSIFQNEISILNNYKIVN